MVILITINYIVKFLIALSWIVIRKAVTTSNFSQKLSIELALGQI